MKTFKYLVVLAAVFISGCVVVPPPHAHGPFVAPFPSPRPGPVPGPVGPRPPMGGPGYR